MKKMTIILLALAMTACNPAKENNDASATDDTNALKVRQNFTQSCTESAVGSDTHNVAKRDYAKLICECVYEEGITHYGGEKAWLAELNAVEKTNQVNEKLNKFSDDAINRCVSKNPPKNSATASQPQ